MLLLIQKPSSIQLPCRQLTHPPLRAPTSHSHAFGRIMHVRFLTTIRTFLSFPRPRCVDQRDHSQSKTSDLAATRAAKICFASAHTPQSHLPLEGRLSPLTSRDLASASMPRLVHVVYSSPIGRVLLLGSFRLSAWFLSLFIPTYAKLMSSDEGGPGLERSKDLEAVGFS